MSEAVLKTAVDTFSNENSPDRIWGLHQRLATRAESAAGTRCRPYVFFPRPFPKGATIISATLRLFAHGSWPSTSRTFTVRRITERWKESGVDGLTWNNAPDVDITESATIVVADSGITNGYEVAVDVTDILQTAAETGVFHGFRITTTSTDEALRYFHASESSDARYRPVLEVEWAVPPGEPTDHRPAGGRSVSLAQPVLSWSFVGEEQSAFQVQISQNADMSAPVYDPGYITSTDEAHDLDGTAFSATDGQLYYWRVRAKDNHGLESPWSDIVSFRRDTKGVLTITSPTEDQAVPDLTPTITHTFTGRAQESVRYVLYRNEGALERIYDSGWIATTVTNHTLPDGLITDEGPYRLHLFVLDDLEREATPGDPRHVEAVRNFTFDCEGVHAPTESLVVADGVDADAPGVVLTWHHDTTPDAWAIKIDGRIVLPEVDPADTAIGGGDHKLVLYNVTGLVEHTFEVVALVDDAGILRHSCDNPEVVFTPEPKGIWLVAPDDGLRCVLVGEDEPEWTLGESGTTHFPIGRRDPVRIIDSLRGYEGRVTGVLVDGYPDATTETAEDWRRALEQIRALPHTAGVRLIIGGHNLGVEVLELSIPPRSNDGYSASVGFIQTSDFTFELKR